MNPRSNPGSNPGSNAVRALRAIAGEAGRPVLRRLWARVEDIAARRVAAELTGVRAELDNLRHALAGLRGDVDDLRGRIEELRGRMGPVETELHQIGVQQGAAETRISALERPAVAGATDPESVALVEEIRAEHARVRARLTAMSHYEERIGRLEETLRRRDGSGLDGATLDGAVTGIGGEA
ncbi:MAG TPA: hypothetical protein VF444_22765 [Pseudonocardiaceae bacterium]